VSTGSAPTIPNDRAAEFDVWVTFALFRYATHVSAGQLDPHAFESQWTLRPERVDLVKVLAQAVTTNDLSKSIDRLIPKHPEYAALQGVLDRYRAIQGQGGWPPVPPVRRLKEGESNPAVPVLRRRLVITGDLNAPRAQDGSHEQDASPVFDATLAEAVHRFQERHRLKPDGIVKPDVVAAMNVPVETRIRQLELNLERWRWLPDQMPDRYIRVNVPDYMLETIEHGQPVMDIRVIVGERELPTPIFADQMTSVVFSPYWNIPPSIVRKEMIPHAAADPGYLVRNNIEVVRGTGGAVDPAAVDWSAPGHVSLRQRPGPRNALGLVKFVFPNNFNVYLHDTPADRLFARIERDFSHGCVRVEEPVKLAEYVLRDQPEWTPEKILAAMHAGRERHVALKTPIPVFILYMTAAADPHGTVRFFDDLYGHDAEQLARLAH
jgi:murein L,D-transpeptidase YcbB/YkuD